MREMGAKKSSWMLESGFLLQIHDQQNIIRKSAAPALAAPGHAAGAAACADLVSDLQCFSLEARLSITGATGTRICFPSDAGLFFTQGPSRCRCGGPTAPAPGHQLLLLLGRALRRAHAALTNRPFARREHGWGTRTRCGGNGGRARRGQQRLTPRQARRKAKRHKQLLHNFVFAL